MAKCFLSYSYGYRHIMEAVRGLLKALDFEAVDVVEEPDDQRPPYALVEARMRAADCVLVLYGPSQQPQAAGQPIAPAKWPSEEAVFARGCDKPLTLILHPGTDLPELLKGHQSPARFDFWNPKSFQENVHHVVKHILDFKRRVDLPPGKESFRYRKVECRNRVSRSGTELYEDWYHEVIVAKERNSFHHAFHTGDRATELAVLACLENGRFDLETGAGGDWHRISLEPGKHNTSEFEYFIRIDPPLQPGEVFGYRRSFELPNRFPLTHQDAGTRIAALKAEQDYHRHIFEDRYYGENINLVYDADSLVMAYHLPKRVKVAAYRVVVAEYIDRHIINQSETARCNEPERLQLRNEPQSPEQVLELCVSRPLVNHSYYLLYELANT